MDLQKAPLDQLSRLMQSSMTTSTEIAKISGEDKTTVTLITLGFTLAFTGILRALNG
ncbi:hypothetical protein [Subsaximicrobium wynnwilliamsii]|jgi:hypothetical protein|uniref:hypothetical protein n=1 Tax=Subsaximicrobium wynnwilliamsii TaxID=291179 RepID=UPI00167B19D1|nr:hypothetical protein [Subsaximicrobium wynnwilliamsii]